MKVRLAGRERVRGGAHAVLGENSGPAGFVEIAHLSLLIFAGRCTTASAIDQRAEELPDVTFRGGG